MVILATSCECLYRSCDTNYEVNIWAKEKEKEDKEENNIIFGL
jgi:hypothetical protein